MMARRLWGGERLARKLMALLPARFRVPSAVVPAPPRRGDRLPLNRLCQPDAWSDPDWRSYGRLLALSQDEGWYHRKAFEWTQCVYGLEQLGVLKPSSRVLGVGAGHECVLYYLANRVRLVVATDLYRGDFVDAEAAEADPAFLKDPARFAPFHYREDHLVGLPADGCRLPFGDNSFDVVYSLSSIEHFGGHDKSAEAMREIGRVLKPGGIACVATEYILEGGTHGEYFTPEEIDVWLIAPSGLVLVEPFDPTPPPAQYLEDPVRLPEEVLKTPHIVLAVGDLRWTSIVLFLRKPRAAEVLRGGTLAALRGIWRRACVVRRKPDQRG